MLKRGTLWMAALLALLLCMAACLPSALAEEFAEPSEANGWEDKEGIWSLENQKNNTYYLPFKSEKSIYIIKALD